MSDDYNDILIDVEWRFPAPKARKRYVPVERAEKAEAAIARVRELHLPCTAFSVQEGGCGPGEHTVSDPPVCFHCQAAWPCPTVKALDGGKASRREPRRAETTTSEQERLI